jgi:hypothetical protein
MRHVLLPRAIAAGPLGMREPAAPAELIAPARGALCTVAGLLGAVSGAVDLAAVTTAADQHLGTAACTQEQPPRERVSAVGSAGPMMTNAAIAATLLRHACPARCGARRRSKTRQLGPAPCEPLMLRRRPRPGQSCQARCITQARQASQDEGKDSGRALGICGVLWSGLRPSRRAPQMPSAPLNASCHRGCRQIYADSGRHRQRSRT